MRCLAPRLKSETTKVVVSVHTGGRPFRSRYDPSAFQNPMDPGGPQLRKWFLSLLVMTHVY